jgi:hypothetical protein
MMPRMRFLWVALVEVLLALPLRAGAAEGLSLTWGECALSGSAAHDGTWTCDSNLGQSDLFCAFGVGAPVDSVLGVEVVVDVQQADAGLPDWWRFEVGGCRSGELLADLDFRARSACADFYHGNATAGLTYDPGQPRGGANQARIRVTASVLPDFGYATLDPATMYYAARLIIRHATTTDPLCAGCAGPACLVLNSITVKRQPGASGGDVVVTTPGAGDANWATWQGGAGANCASVPVRAVTWGRIKGLYR